jgi:hypothetical protein
MNAFTKEELLEASQAIASTINKCEKVQLKLKEGSSQYTLLERRIKAFGIAIVLIESAVSSRLASFEAVRGELSGSINTISVELKRLKAAGKEKTVRYRELFAQKLMNSHIIALFERHGITFAADDPGDDEHQSSTNPPYGL